MADESLLKKLLATGEEQAGRLVNQLLANERFVSGVQTTVAAALQAKGVLDKQLASTLEAMHVPTRDDVRKLNERLDELERIFEGLADKVDRIASRLDER